MTLQHLFFPQHPEWFVQKLKEHVSALLRTVQEPPISLRTKPKALESVRPHVIGPCCLCHLTSYHSPAHSATLTSVALHLLCPLSGSSASRFVKWLAPSLHSELCSNITWHDQRALWNSNPYFSSLPCFIIPFATYPIWHITLLANSLVAPIRI